MLGMLGCAPAPHDPNRIKRLKTISNKLHFLSTHPNTNFTKCLHAVAAARIVLALGEKILLIPPLLLRVASFFYDTEVTGFN